MRCPSRAGARALPVLLIAVLAVVLGMVSAGAAPCTQTDPIERHYCELGGAASVLGPPLGGQYPVGPGRGQDYTRGRIFWSAASGAHEVYGGIGERYGQTGGRSDCSASR